jgi:isopentenyl diphosphate isomerase/L-lactate dehydrogenase-like FMN-dependent dehydrogenase
MSETENAGDSTKIARDYFDSLLIETRHLDAPAPSTKLELFGAAFATPVMFAALSHLDGVRPNGMVESAKGVAKAGAVMWVGIGSEEELEAIIATGAKTIKIIKPYADTDLILKKIAHAEKSGALAVGMDIDNGFGARMSPGFAANIPVKPKTLEDIKTYVQATKLPFIVKGVLSETDAKKCLDAGARGIVVSHHRGVVDYAVPPLQVLPGIVKVIGKRIPIFVDCGITRGMDVFKALALGAAAVSVGVAIMKPLGAEGAEGVQKLFEEMTAELNWAMALTGSRDIASIDPAVIWKR